MTDIPEAVLRLSSRLWADLNTPRSLACAILARSKEWEQLAGLKLNPAHYHDTYSGLDKFRRDLQATDLLRKSPLPIRVSRPDQALAGWYQDEWSNAKTNARLKPWLTGYPPSLESRAAGRIWNFIQTARREIARVLGPVPDYLPPGRFGPGTALGFDRDRLAWLPNKLSTTITITSGARAVFEHDMPPTWEASLRSTNTPFYEVVDYERFSTVPKSALTDRTIGIQPLGNLWSQLAVGLHIRRRLLHSVACIDLNYGQDLHRRKARESSLSNGDATIDLKSASNSLTRVLVRLLLPTAWHDLLATLRCPISKFSSGRCYLEMFSAMGNGFTFELETLIFWSICRACGVEKPYVYGDDIIVPKASARDVTSALAYFGFNTNPKKTFTEGPFRESCGGDFFIGEAVTPYRMTKFPSDPLGWMEVHNGLRRPACLRGRVGHRARLVAIHQIPTAVRFGGPAFVPGTLHGEPAVERLRDSIRWIKALVPQSRSFDYARFGGNQLHMAMALIGIPSTGYTPRDCVVGHKVKWVSAS